MNLNDYGSGAVESGLIKQQSGDSAPKEAFHSAAAITLTGFSLRRSMVITAGCGIGLGELAQVMLVGAGKGGKVLERGTCTRTAESENSGSSCGERRVGQGAKHFID